MSKAMNLGELREHLDRAAGAVKKDAPVVLVGAAGDKPLSIGVLGVEFTPCDRGRGKPPGEVRLRIGGAAS